MRNLLYVEEKDKKTGSKKLVVYKSNFNENELISRILGYNLIRNENDTKRGYVNYKEPKKTVMTSEYLFKISLIQMLTKEIVSLEELYNLSHSESQYRNARNIEIIKDAINSMDFVQTDVYSLDIVGFYNRRLMEEKKDNLIDSYIAYMNKKTIEDLSINIKRKVYMK